MASPQCENGYIRFATELWKAICRIRISGESRQIFDVIAQKTYGFNKKDDAISLSQFSLATGITKPNICQALTKLKEMNLITQKDNEIANVYSINKDFQSWKPLPKKITLPKKIMTITQKDNKYYPKSYPQYTVSIDTITIDNKCAFAGIWKLYPRRVGKKAALKHYKTSVKTEQDYIDIQKALANYLKSETVIKGFIQNGSTWFNNWRDWIDYQEPKKHIETTEERDRRMYKEMKERLGAKINGNDGDNQAG